MSAEARETHELRMEVYWHNAYLAACITFALAFIGLLVAALAGFSDPVLHSDAANNAYIIGTFACSVATAGGFIGILAKWDTLMWFSLPWYWYVARPRLVPKPIRALAALLIDEFGEGDVRVRYAQTDAMLVVLDESGQEVCVAAWLFGRVTYNGAAC